MLGISRGIHEIFALLGRYAEQNDRQLREFFTILAQFQRVKQSNKDRLKATGTITFPYVLTFTFLDSNTLTKYFT
jgi:hypothetical protein